MKNRKSKIKSFFLVFLMFLSLVNFCEPQVVRASDTVAYVYIITCTSTVGSSEEGKREHTFLAVKNLLDEDLRVGHYNLGGKHIMTIGSFGNIYDGKYAYYNVEKYRMVNDLASYTPNVYLRAAVSASQMEKFGEAINRSNVWTEIYNCAGFARDCWNSMFSVLDDEYIPSSTIESPLSIFDKIKSRLDCRYNFEFGDTRTCTMDKVFVHTSTDKENLSIVAQYQVMLKQLLLFKKVANYSENGHGIIFDDTVS